MFMYFMKTIKQDGKQEMPSVLTTETQRSSYRLEVINKKIKNIFS